MEQIKWSPDRVTIRDFEHQDRDALVAGLNNLDVARWLSHVPHPYTRADADTFLAKDKRGTKAVFVEDVLVGGVSDAAHLGYWFIPQVWGQGLASFVARAQVSAAFEKTPTATLKAGYFVGNDGSARVLQKCGFQEVSCGQAQCAALQRPLRHVAMEATLTDWRAVQ